MVVLFRNEKRLIHATLFATNVLQYNYNISKEVILLATNQVQNIRDAHAAGDGAKEQKEYDKYVENMTAGGHKPKSLKELRG